MVGGFSAFVIALFTEMYGYPLAVHLLIGPWSGLVPGVDLSHLLMFPGLVYVYRRLAIREERKVAAQLGSVYDDYARRTPRFLPHLHAPPPPLAGSR